MQIDWNAKVKEALDRTEFMAVSTVDENGSWVCPVYFGYDEKLNLYFISMPDSKHVQNILKDERVAVAIFKTEYLPNTDRDVLGLQLKGTAHHLDSHDEVLEAVRHYYGREAKNIDYTSKVVKHLGDNAVWNFYKVTPTEAWCFDSRIFGEHRRQIDLANLNIPISNKK